MVLSLILAQSLWQGMKRVLLLKTPLLLRIAVFFCLCMKSPILFGMSEKAIKYH
jgi:hypothetical protein